MITGLKSHRSILLFLFLIPFIFCDNVFAQDTLLYPSLPPGIQAPVFKGKNENRKTVSLTKVKARLTLLYFYEVNCHLCEVVTPELKKLYDSYHKLGLEIIAIPLESGREEWKRYITDHGLTWKNVFLAPVTRDKVRSDYKLTVSPTMYLLDKNKILLSQRMGRIEQVEDELNKRIR